MNMTNPSETLVLLVAVLSAGLAGCAPSAAEKAPPSRRLPLGRWPSWSDWAARCWPTRIARQARDRRELSATPITDAGLAHLRALGAIQVLYLN